MSKRNSIVKALAEKLKEIDGTGTYKSNLHGNASHIRKFWDEVNDFPAAFVTPGTETREYHPSSLVWGYLPVTISLYTRDEENSQDQLEDLIDDVERLITANRQLQFDESDPSKTTTEILIISIGTDEGVLAPYGIGDIVLQVRYPIM